MDEDGRTAELLERAAQGDREALDELFRMHRERLLLMVRMRLHPRMRGRVDASDVVQEACLEAMRDGPLRPTMSWERLRELTREP